MERQSSAHFNETTLFQTHVVYDTVKPAFWKLGAKRSWSSSTENCRALRSLFCCKEKRMFVFWSKKKTRQVKAYLSWKLIAHDEVFHENQKVYNFCWDFLASHTEMYESMTQGMNERTTNERMYENIKRIIPLVGDRWGWLSFQRTWHKTMSHAWDWSLLRGITQLQSEEPQ